MKYNASHMKPIVDRRIFTPSKFAGLPKSASTTWVYHVVYQICIHTICHKLYNLSSSVVVMNLPNELGFNMTLKIHCHQAYFAVVSCVNWKGYVVAELGRNTFYQMIFKTAWEPFSFVSIWPIRKYELSWIQFVLGTRYLRYEVSWVRGILVWCLEYEISWVPVILSTSYLGYELSWVRLNLGKSCLGYVLPSVWVVHNPVKPIRTICVATRTTRTHVFSEYPHRPMITHTIESYRTPFIPSQNDAV